MASEILAVGTGEASSSDVVLDAGDKVTIALKGGATDEPSVPSGARVKVLLKDDDGYYWEQFELAVPNQTCIMLEGPATYKVTRLDNGVTCGAFTA